MAETIIPEASTPTFVNVVGPAIARAEPKPPPTATALTAIDIGSAACAITAAFSAVPDQQPIFAAEAIETVVVTLESPNQLITKGPPAEITTAITMPVSAPCRIGLIEESALTDTKAGLLCKAPFVIASFTPTIFSVFKIMPSAGKIDKITCKKNSVSKKIQLK